MQQRIPPFSARSAKAAIATSKNYRVFSEYTSFTLSKAIKTGGKWTLWVGFSGASSFEANSGTLNKVTAGAHGPTSLGTMSTLANVKRLIAGPFPLR